LLFLLQCERPRDLHSFPPRRSSDLESGRCSDPRWRIEHPLKGKLDVASREGLAVVKLDTFPELKLPLQVAELGPRDCKSRHQLEDRKSTRLNSSHVKTSYAVFCLKK